MANKIHNIGIAAQIGAYSDAVETGSNLRWLLTSGTPGLQMNGDLPSDIAGQTELAWKHILRILAVVAICAILILAAMKPSTFIVERSVSINAPPEKIAPLINDFHSWDTWSPWAKLDPAMKTVYSGAPSGVGAIYEWEGNSKVGKGRMEVTSIQPAKTTIKLDFLKPFEGHNTADFVLEPQGSATRVTWVMYGPLNFIPGKLMSVFTTMDKMIGDDFQRGLANLKVAAEK